jgi:hypothetical protein
MCIHDHEGAWDDHGYYGGGMQFLVSTWNRVAGGEIPFVTTTTEIGKLSPRIQLHAAMRVWLQDHRSWHEWGTAGVCGLA